MKKLLLIILNLVIITGFAYADEPEKKFQGFNLQGYSDNGQKAWDVNGETADINGGEITLSNVVGNSYGKEPVNVTAANGTINQASGNMHLQKDVIITAQNGTQLMTDSLNWNRTKDMVTTPDDVVITDDKMTVTGKGMEAKPGLKLAQVKEDVTVRVKTDPKKVESKVVTITSDGPMEIDQQKSIATFNENVVAVQENQTLKADKMDVYFDQQASTIKQIICSGNVQIIQGENKTYADKATYDGITKKVVLSGRPKLILLTEGNNAFTAPGN